MAKHKDFTVATNVKVYFCDPQSPWQRGTNESTNRLLRQYLPKRTDLSGYTQSQLDKIALRLNQRPRKTLGFQTPASKLRTSVAPTSWARICFWAGRTADFWHAKSSLYNAGFSISPKSGPGSGSNLPHR
jgi:hypothetical protein